jgi:magnesium transporter
MATIALSELLGSPVLDASGEVSGRVREVALYPTDNTSQVAGFIVRTAKGDRMLSSHQVASVEARSVRSSASAADWGQLHSSEGFLLLERDLLDQQIIDVHGRKVVRVNDVGLALEQDNGHPRLKISDVEVGPRGAVRRLLKGVVPRAGIQALVSRFSPRIIPWDFVDLIEIDPARRVRLKIEHERLSRLHPADIADILEELAPAQREAVFESLDEDVAAEALEEIDPKMQAALVESLDSEHAADIVEEMDPDAAADLLEKLSAKHSEQILDEMGPEEREDVEELLEHKENTAAGRMTTDYVAVREAATVADAIQQMRSSEGGVENVSHIYLVDGDKRLKGVVPLARLALNPGSTSLAEVAISDPIFCWPDASDQDVFEIFDKYNLMALPVVDREGVLVGIITADDVISLLRKRL